MAVPTLLIVGLFIAGVTSEFSEHDYRRNSFDLLRLLTEKPWLDRGHWARPPRDPILDTPGRGALLEDRLADDVLRSGSEKRSAVASALHAGRPRRQPSPTLGKAVMHAPYVGVGVINDMEIFFDALRDNLDTLATMPREEQSSTFYHDTPSVVHAPSSGGGSGSGIGKLNALRPLRPAGDIRYYNRRSFMEADGAYPGAHHHNPELLWTGLGR